MKGKPSKDQFPRLYQIYEESDKSDPDKNFLYGLFNEAHSQEDLFFWGYWESLFQNIVERENWDFVKSKIIEVIHTLRETGKIEIKGEPEKQQVKKIFAPGQCFDIFNEVHGYLFLKIAIGCEKINFIELSKKKKVKTPDLEGFKGQIQFVLEVKTINTSDDDHFNKESVVNPIEGHIFPKPSSDALDRIKSKISRDIKKATNQFETFPQAQKIIFFVIDLDLNCNTPDFRENLIKHGQALVNRDLTICGIFQFISRWGLWKWNPNLLVAPFLDQRYERYLLELINGLKCS